MLAYGHHFHGYIRRCYVIYYVRILFGNTRDFQKKDINTFAKTIPITSMMLIIILL